MAKNFNWYYHKLLAEFYRFNSNSPDDIILSDTLSTVDDIQSFFHELRTKCKPGARIFVNMHNFLWKPVLSLAEALRIKEPQKVNNWLTIKDVTNLLELEDFEVISAGSRILMPIYIPVISEFCNRVLAHLPIVNTLCFMNYLVARPRVNQKQDMSVSIVIPVRNESGNLESVIRRIPTFGTHQELIFVEGNSKDGSWNTLQQLKKKYRGTDIKLYKQKGVGKADAMRLGFAKATGDIFLILDADASVSPEDMVKFYDAVISGKGEFINGSRLVYPVEKEAMRFLNILGNQFFSVALSWIINQKIKDTLCGTKAISRINYKRIVNGRSYFGDFDPFGDFDLIFGSAKLNLKFIEVPVRYHARVYGTTNISRFRHGLLLAKMTLFALGKMKFV